YRVPGTDANGDELTLEAQGALPPGVQLNGATVSWTPSDADIRTQPYPFTIRAVDPFGATSAWRTFNVTVAVDAEAPTVDLTLTREWMYVAPLEDGMDDILALSG